MSRSYEVCVVGGSIAGSALAHKLAPDLDVCVIEKKGLDQVGRKPCPGAVGKSWFEGLPNPDELGAVSRRVKGMKLTAGGRVLRVNFDGYVIDRNRFCRSLLEAAMRDGCELLRAKARPRFEKGMIRVRARGKKIDAGIYVDASGVSAVLRKHYLPNGPEMFALGYMETIVGEHDSGELDIRLLNPRETCWIFPAESSTNLGYVAAEASGKELLGRLGSFKGRLGLDGAKVLEKGYRLIPSHKPIGLVHGNVVAIGDAGLTVNPVTCGGIGPSIATAKMLAESLREGCLEEFESRYRRELGRKFEKLHHINRVLRRGWLPIWFAVKAYYCDNPLGKLIKRLLKL